MFVSQKVVAAFCLLAPAVTAFKHPGRQLSGGETVEYPTCMVPGSMKCENEDHQCDEINGHKYWQVSEITTDAGACRSQCVSESDLEFMLDRVGPAWECGPCPVCPSDMRCKMDGKDTKFSIFRYKSNGKCEEKCEKAEKVGQKMSKDGFACGVCPPNASKEEGSTVYDPDAIPPTPDKCTLKRALHLMRYEPNWPLEAKNAGIPGAVIQIEIRAVNSGNIYTYDVDYDYTKSEMLIVNDAEFYDMYDANKGKDEQGVEVRFVSDRGPGGWQGCNYSPIAIDLNRDGEITRLLPEDVGREEGWTIDITGDGEEEYLNEWFGPGDGILVDLSGKYELFEEDAAKHGRRVQEHIITGVQLLGDQGGQYADGFAKLAKRDEDGDGILENKELVGLHLWIDANSNARLDKGELANLIDFKIVGLRVTHDGMKSTAILTNGEEILMEDLWLSR